MRKISRNASLGVAAVAVGMAISAPPAGADPVRIDWYLVSPSFPDFNLAPCGVQDCGQSFTNEVGQTLVGGLPVVSAANPAGLAEGPGNPLNWWTPSAGVAFEGQTIQQLPAVQNMFAPEGMGGDDSSGFQTAIFMATLHVGPGGGSITFGGDDDMFLALNGSVVDQVGGIHPFGATATYTVAPGTYAMDVFYADRHVVAAYADIELTGDVTTSVPESATWAMILLGFAGLGYAASNRGRKDRLGSAIA